MITREVKVNDHSYYYLFHTSGTKPFKKYIKFLGENNPSSKEVKKLESAFLKEIKLNPQVDTHHNIIVLLQKIQEVYGYIPESEIVRLSKELDIPAVDITGVATFYSQFKLIKPGKYKVSICRGTACHVKNSIELLKYLEEILGVKAGQTQESGKISLDIVNCLGACAKAPVMMINGQVYGELTKDKVKTIIGGLK
jgi:NADH:ubiquinone oxidoreductase subunit E